VPKIIRASGVALAGLVTSLLTAILVTAIDKLTGFNVFTFSIWIVVPVGAGICGVLAASGYYLGAKVLHQRPTPILLVQMVAIAALTLILIYWLEYQTTSVDGMYISQAVSFPDYMDIVLTKTHMRLGRGGIDTGEVGSFGYWLAFFEFVGFLLGGTLVYIYLRNQPTCSPCNKYLRTLTRKKDSFADVESLSAYYDNEFANAVDSPEFAAHVGTKHSTGKTEQGAFNLETKVLGCPSCGCQAVSEKVQVFDGRDWKDVDQLTRFVPMPAGTNVAHAYR
jgi:hypothetical protein